jgi:hypothetical protein
VTALPVRRRCGECSAAFLAVRYDQVFCKQTCRRAWHAWCEGRGARASELLIKWRRDRRRGSLAALTAFADELVRDHRDREVDRKKGERGGGLTMRSTNPDRASYEPGVLRASASILRFATGRLGGRR